MKLFFSMIYAEPFVRGSDPSSQWRGQTSDKPCEAPFRSALRIKPDDPLAQDCLNELLKVKGRPQRQDLE
jgi:hypothetical protein